MTDEEIHGMHVALGGDGWEHAHPYHHLLEITKQGQFAMFMPSLRGEGMHLYTTPYYDYLSSLVSDNAAMRLVGFSAFSRCARREVVKRCD